MTVRIGFSDSQRMAAGDVGSVSGPNVLSTLDEPSAAATAFGEDETGGAPAAAPLLGGIFGPARMGGMMGGEGGEEAAEAPALALAGDDPDGSSLAMPARKRPRPDAPVALGVNGAAQAVLADAG